MGLNVCYMTRVDTCTHMGGFYGVTKRSALHTRLICARCDSDFVFKYLFPAKFDFEYSKRHVKSSNHGSWAVGYFHLITFYSYYYDCKVKILKLNKDCNRFTRIMI